MDRKESGKSNLKKIPWATKTRLFHHQPGNPIEERTTKWADAYQSRAEKRPPKAFTSASRRDSGKRPSVQNQ